MSKAEIRAEQAEMHKRHFLAAFRELHDQGRQWIDLGAVMPIAAQRDDVFMAKRRLHNDIVLLFTGRKREEAPYGLNYPPKASAQDIVDGLVDEGLIKGGPNALAQYDETGSEPFMIYKLAPETQPPVTGSQLDVGITTA